MSKRRAFSLLAATLAVVFSSLMCNIDSREADRELEAQNMTSVALEATRFSGQLTQTAAAAATDTPTLHPPTDTPTPAPTNTSVPPTSTPLFSNLPEALFALSDPTGDPALCATGATVDDPAVDIIAVEVYDPADLGFDHDGLLARITLGMPADLTFANDWSAALLGAFAPTGAITYTVKINETHNGEVRLGQVDNTTGEVLPGTEGDTFFDPHGHIWFLLPADTSFMQFASFHSPETDMPPEEKRCDVAPDSGLFTLTPP